MILLFSGKENESMKDEENINELFKDLTEEQKSVILNLILLFQGKNKFEAEAK